MRRKDREITSAEETAEIIKKAKILHLGLFDGNFPYVVPLHYGFEKDPESGKYLFYFHGAREGHKLDLIHSNPNVCIELDCDAVLVPGKVPCGWGSEYASVIGRGTAEILENPQEKIHGLNLLMKNQTGREFEITEAMASSVAVIRVTVSELTAKARKHQKD